MENARRLDLRLVLGAIAIVSVVVAIWAATALAGGSSSSSSNEPGGGNAPVVGYVQDESESQDGQGRTTPQRGDCPERDGGDGGGDSGSSDTSSSDV